MPSPRRSQSADASHNSRLLPPEREGKLPGPELDPLHSALQPGWETTRSGSTVQVRKSPSPKWQMRKQRDVRCVF